MAEANEDEWSYEGSTDIPRPYTITYQLDLWSKTIGEALYQYQEFEYQFLHGMEIVDVNYPEPFNTRECLLDNPECINNSDLEPGEAGPNVRYTFTFDFHGWISPRVARTNPVKTADMEYYDYITEELYGEETVFSENDTE